MNSKRDWDEEKQIASIICRSFPDPDLCCVVLCMWWTERCFCDLRHNFVWFPYFDFLTIESILINFSDLYLNSSLAHSLMRFKMFIKLISIITKMRHLFYRIYGQCNYPDISIKIRTFSCRQYIGYFVCSVPNESKWPLNLYPAKIIVDVCPMHQ